MGILATVWYAPKQGVQAKYTMLFELINSILGLYTKLSSDTYFVIYISLW